MGRDTWVFFRAESIQTAMAIIGKVFDFSLKLNQELLAVFMQTKELMLIDKFVSQLGQIPGLTVYLFYIAALLMVVLLPNAYEVAVRRFKISLGRLLCIFVLLVWSILSLSDGGTFLYFNF